MKDWLDFLYPGYGLTEMRAIRAGEGTVQQRWYSPAFIGDLPSVAAYFDQSKWDVYVGVLPRKSAAGTADSVWPTATVLWCDVDAKDFCPDPVLHSPESKLQGDPNYDKELALDAILKFPLPPSAIVDSGHGYHLYWRLASPVDTADAVEANQAIAKWLGGDKCFDAPRILRVPGTNNWKDPVNPIPVRILKLDTLRTYDLSDFTEMIEALHLADRPRYIRSGERRQDAPDWLRDLINEEPPKGTRSETEFRAGMWMARLGYTDEAIDSTLLNSPVGAKYQERSGRWREAELRRIRSKA